MKNKKLINEEIRLIKSLMSYDTSKTLTEQEWSTGMDYTVNKLPNEKILTRDDVIKYVDNFVDGLDGWVTVDSLKQIIKMANKLNGKFYKDKGNFKKLIENGNVSDIDVEEQIYVKDGDYWYYPAMAYVMWLYQSDEGGDTLIGDIADLSTITWSAGEAELKTDAESAIRKSLEVMYKTQAEIDLETEDYISEYRTKLFRDFPCFSESLNNNEIEYIGIYKNEGTNPGIYIKYKSEGKTYVIYNSGKIFQRDNNKWVNVGKIKCNVNESFIKEGFDIVDDSSKVVLSVNDKSDNTTTDSTSTDNTTTDSTSTDNTTTDSTSTDNTTTDSTSTNDCSSIEITEDIKKVIKMLQNKNAILMKGSHNQESKVVGIKDTIKLIQCIVGTDIDGIFGIDTDKKVKEFQTSNKPLVVDGKVGENTINKMIELELIKI
jgi:hypothetical protein